MKAPTRLCCNHAILQSCKDDHAKMQSCKDTIMQGCNHTRIQLRSYAIMRSYKHDSVTDDWEGRVDPLHNCGSTLLIYATMAGYASDFCFMKVRWILCEKSSKQVRMYQQPLLDAVRAGPHWLMCTTARQVEAWS
jgi:hypothetical protein